MIGILDSGLGGKGIEREVRALLPEAPVRYFRDTTNFPYGDKPPAEVVRIIDENCGRLVAEGAKLIVLACNSASVVSLAHLRAKYAIPFVGVVPAVKPAAARTRTKQIAVFGTELTSRSAALQELIDKFCAGITVHKIAPARAWPRRSRWATRRRARDRAEDVGGIRRPSALTSSCWDARTTR